ncbi:hypothetical protein GE09DRAFT_1054383 [Coniochaeta sp. 2T2.1]|nr:hypothetical protein GE09DRAFT_1054383 [Coniochaeta sp. 2T2.1]
MPTIPNPQVAQADPLPPDAQTDLGLRLAGPSLPAGSKETAIDTIDDGGSLQPAAIIQPRGNACDTFTPSKADNPPNRGSDKPPQINPPQLNRFQTNHFHISPFNNSPFNNPFHINSFQTGPDLVFPFYPNSGPFYSSPFYHPTCLTNPLNPYLGPNLFDFGPLGPNLLPDVTATTDTAKDPTATGCEDS